jgi:uncharacterized membrane protein YjdF
MNWGKIIYKAILPPALIFLLNIFFTYAVDIYGFFPWFDILMHFIGGFCISFSVWLVLRDSGLGKTFKGSSGVALKGLFMLGLTMTIAVAWEWYEFILDKLFSTFNQGGVADTMGDLLMGFLGSLSAIILYAKKKK